jgi:hypothetical protein
VVRLEVITEKESVHQPNRKSCLESTFELSFAIIEPNLTKQSKSGGGDLRQIQHSVPWVTSNMM